MQRVGQQARDSLDKEPDCHLFDVCISDDRPNFVFLYEVYTDPQAFQLHLESDYFLAFDAEVGDWVVDKVVAQYRQVK